MHKLSKYVWHAIGKSQSFGRGKFFSKKKQRLFLRTNMGISYFWKDLEAKLLTPGRFFTFPWKLWGIKEDEVVEVLSTPSGQVGPREIRRWRCSVESLREGSTPEGWSFLKTLRMKVKVKVKVRCLQIICLFMSWFWFITSKMANVIRATSRNMLSAKF